MSQIGLTVEQIALRRVHRAEELARFWESRGYETVEQELARMRKALDCIVDILVLGRVALDRDQIESICREALAPRKSNKVEPLGAQSREAQAEEQRHG